MEPDEYEGSLDDRNLVTSGTQENIEDASNKSMEVSNKKDNGEAIQRTEVSKVKDNSTTPTP